MLASLPLTYKRDGTTIGRAIMEFAGVVKRRRMVRNFSDVPVAPDQIERILDLARRAPSAGYTQGQSFIVVTDPELRKDVGACCGEEHYTGDGFHPFNSIAPV